MKWTTAYASKINEIREAATGVIPYGDEVPIDMPLEEAYEQRLLCGIPRELMLNNKRTLRIGAPEQSGRVISRVLLRLGWNVERSCA